jgi:hypothetical protein
MKKNEHLLNEIGKIDDDLIEEAAAAADPQSAADPPIAPPPGDDPPSAPLPAATPHVILREVAESTSPTRAKMQRIRIASISACAVAAVIMLALFLPGMLDSKQPQQQQQPQQPQQTIQIPPQKNEAMNERIKFADYIPYEFTGEVKVPQYKVKKDLSNIVNLKQFTDPDYFFSVANLTKEAKDKIAQNGFVVDDSASRTEFFGVYEDNRYSYAPSFITTDSTTHTFHQMFDYVLKNLEQEKLSGILKDLSDRLVKGSLAQYKALKGTDFENAAMRNIAFYSTGAKLLDSDYDVPAQVKDYVAKETDLIERHDSPEVSPILNMGEAFTDPTEYQLMDYTQYIPRGHYTKSEELKAYFKAQMWYGQATLRSAYEDEVKSAVLQTVLLKNKENEESWYALFSPISFFVGECDDITYLQYEEALTSAYGKDFTDLNPATDPNTATDAQAMTEPQPKAVLKTISEPEKFAAAWAIIKKLEAPKINSVPVFNEDIQPDTGKAITGFRFLGQRFTIDASIFQQLMERQTPGRMLPKALDIPAAFGSELATGILEKEGEMDKYPEYGPNLQKVQDYTKSIDAGTWTSNLYWSWLYTLRPLTETAAATGTDTGTLPLFMQNEAWRLKSLNTFEGSWTELKHDTLLYAKQPMAEMGGDGWDEQETPDDRGYVEPNPVFYGRLAALIGMTTDGLKTRDLLTPEAEESLDVLHDIARNLTTISEKELTGEALTDEEYEKIRNYGGELEHIWAFSQKEEPATASDISMLFEHPGAIVADIATGDGKVLEEATGYAKTIYVAFPRDGKVALGRGVVYSQYEFTLPVSDRMTDEEWHKRLTEGNLPAVADWKKPFMANIGKSEYADK